MRNLLLAAGVALAGVSAGNAADALIVPEEAPVSVDTSFVNSVYFQVLGGAALGGDLDIYVLGGDVLNNTIPLNAGYGLAGTVGVTVWDGLSVEGDVFYTVRELDQEDAADYSTLSLMANLKYTLDLNDSFALYGAVGLGVIKLDEDDSFTYSGPGYQVIVGATARLTDNLSGLVEYRHQAGFEPLPRDGDDYYALDAPVGSVLAGLKMNF